MNEKPNIKGSKRKIIKSRDINTNSHEIKKQISELSYEEAIESLDKLLEELQGDNLPIEQLEENYRKGKIFIEHCESILKNLEQNITELNLEELNKQS